MNITLIEGRFKTKDAVEIISQMIKVKIAYHESLIDQESNEEDIKFRESKIRHLQGELSKVREYAASNGDMISLQSNIEIQ